MRFVWPLIWAFLISCVISYVLGSMAGNAFDLTGTIAVAVIITIAVYILGEGVLKDSAEQ